MDIRAYAASKGLQVWEVPDLSICETCGGMGQVTPPEIRTLPEALEVAERRANQLVLDLGLVLERWESLQGGRIDEQYYAAQHLRDQINNTLWALRNS